MFVITDIVQVPQSPLAKEEGGGEEEKGLIFFFNPRTFFFFNDIKFIKFLYSYERFA